MSTWFDDLSSRCAALGHDPVEIASGDGRLLAVRHGARLLACELPGVDHNLFFHTETESGPTGGDRLWIAPETAYFWPSLEEARRAPKETAETPASVDPGAYRVEEVAGGVVMKGDAIALRDSRSGATATASALRSFEAIDAPALAGAKGGGLARVSFSITNKLSMEAGDPGKGGAACEGGGWDILQVPPTGTLICPTVARGVLSSYYDPFGDRHVSVEADRVRFLIDGERRIKMGIAPEQTAGRMGYYRALGGGRASLIVRMFPSLPGERYCDLPRDHAAQDAAVSGGSHGARYRGDVLQAYNDDGDAFPGTTFGEMEYHDPCATFAPKSGTSVTHVLVGPDAAVREAGLGLLGVGIDPIV